MNNCLPHEKALLHTTVWIELLKHYPDLTPTQALGIKAIDSEPIMASDKALKTVQLLNVPMVGNYSLFTQIFSDYGKN